MSVCVFTLSKAFDLPVDQKRDMGESDARERLPKVSSPLLMIKGISDGVLL